MNELMQRVSAAMTARGFEVYTAETIDAAREKALSLIAPGQSIGIGGSMTVRELGLPDALEATGHPVWQHWKTAEDKQTVLENARHADVYLCSANAVTADGQILNTDGTGNRVAATIHGPQTLMLLVGRQKLVDGGLSAAIARIKRVACPANARRLGLSTPCALTGACNPNECGDECMCRVTSIHHRPMRGQRAIVILIDADLGC